MFCLEKPAQVATNMAGDFLSSCQKYQVFVAINVAAVTCLAAFSPETTVTSPPPHGMKIWS